MTDPTPRSAEPVWTDEPPSEPDWYWVAYADDHMRGGGPQIAWILKTCALGLVRSSAPIESAEALATLRRRAALADRLAEALGALMRASQDAYMSGQIHSGPWMQARAALAEMEGTA